jgi:hypothetical protein
VATLEKLLEIREHLEHGYLPVVDYGAWRVAVLNYSPEFRSENIKRMQRHNDTDEVFVLLRGRCLLFVADGDEAVSGIYAQDMRPFKVYNVKKGVWHAHALSEDAMVLIVENKDTTYDNSPFCPLTPDQQKTVAALVKAAVF